MKSLRGILMAVLILASISPTHSSDIDPIASPRSGAWSAHFQLSQIQLENLCDLAVKGRVYEVDDHFALRLRRIGFIITETLIGSHAVGDTISIIQISPPGDASTVDLSERAFAVDDSVEVYLRDISGPEVDDPWNALAIPIALPDEELFFIFAAEQGVIDLRGGGRSTAMGGDSILRGFSSGREEECCIWLNFLDESLECDGRFAGLEWEIRMLMFDQIWNALFAVMGPDCFINLTLSQEDCAEANTVIEVKVGAPAAKDANGRALFANRAGYAPESEVDTHYSEAPCASGTVHVYSEIICDFLEMSDTRIKMATTAANVAVHEIGHQFGCPHSHGSVMVRHPDGSFATEAKQYSQASADHIRDCCCDPPGARPSTWGEIKTLYD